MLSVSNFAKSYAGKLIIQLPKWELPVGIHWLKGSNGSGKTTLFKSIAGMLPYDGQIVLNNEFDCKKHPVAYRMRVNYSEAEPLFPEFLSAWELIQWVGKAKKAPTDQITTLVDAFAIRDFMKTPVGTYSSGMLKKTSLIMGFLGNPCLILLDEPLITLDQAATQTVARLVSEHSQQGVSFLLSSHQDFSLAALPIHSTWQVANQTLILETT
jgi:ABC-2 type transport system ATP-binding protein